MDPNRTLRHVVEALEAADIAYMVTGSIAGSYHGIPRSTQDIDLVVEGTEDQLARFLSGLARRDFYVSPEAMREAVRERGQFNVIDRATAWKVDLIVKKDRDFSRIEFERRQRDETMGIPLWIATAEDTILSKLEWAKHHESRRQLEDVVGILRTTGSELDEAYLRRWASRLDLEEEWQRARVMSEGD